MITGGVLDAKEKGTPGELKMKLDMVRAVCGKAHELGFVVAAHVESTEGVRHGARVWRRFDRARRCSDG